MESGRLTVFDGLTGAEVERLVLPLERRRFARGETVIAEGDRPRRMYIVAAGTADVVIHDRAGREHRVNLAGPGGVIGEMSLLTGQGASATVRASQDLDVWVVSEAEFGALASAFPRVYRNIVAILADRLVRSDRRGMPHGLGRLAWLLDDGAPPWLARALAASVAWHSRRSTLLLVLHDGVAGEDADADGDALPEPAAGSPRAQVADRGPDGLFSIAALHQTLERLRLRFDQVLVLWRRADPPGACSARAVRLAGEAVRLSAGSDSPVAYTVRATGSAGRPGPDAGGVLRVPPLMPADEAAIQAGSLPANTPAGTALGWAARDLVGLKVGLALGAGSMKGYAHVGVLSVLARAGLTFDCVSGTSIGAAVAALHAMEYSPDGIAETLDRVGRNLVRPTLPFDALLSNRRLRARLRRITGDRRIEDLALPLAVVAADLITGREVLFRRGPLWSAVLASMALPGIFPPQPVGRYRLVDGGILNPVPTAAAAALGADVVVAVRLAVAPAAAGAVEPTGKASGSRSVVGVILRAIDVMQSKISADTAAAATILIEPQFASPAGYGLRDMSRGRRFVELGEAAAEASLPRLRSALPWLDQ